MAKYNAFLAIVTQRDDLSIDRDKTECPYCHSLDIKIDGDMTTLVGGYNNHITRDCTCNSCKKSFSFQFKEQGERNDIIGWYVDSDKKVLRGIPGCFEYYVYTCSECGGEVHRHQFELESDTPVEWLRRGPDENGVWQNFYRTVFKCDSCDAQVESENDYYYRNPPPEMTYEEKVKKAKEDDERSRKLMAEWKIVEEPGICIINDAALANVELTEAIGEQIEIDEDS
jgi:hypothetical protein